MFVMLDVINDNLVFLQVRVKRKTYQPALNPVYIKNTKSRTYYYELKFIFAQSVNNLDLARNIYLQKPDIETTLKEV